MLRLAMRLNVVKGQGVADCLTVEAPEIVHGRDTIKERVQAVGLVRWSG